MMNNGPKTALEAQPLGSVGIRHIQEEQSSEEEDAADDHNRLSYDS